jgi:hypothetical protein
MSSRGAERGHNFDPVQSRLSELHPTTGVARNELHPVFGTRKGDCVEDHLAERAKVQGVSVEHVVVWRPPK